MEAPEKKKDIFQSKGLFVIWKQFKINTLGLE